MKFLKSWLQDTIKEPLPHDDEIVDVLNKKAFEVEGTGKIDSDSVFDIKILPNRAHDALGHIFMSKEICACLSLTFENEKVRNLADKRNFASKENKIETKIENVGCLRFMSMRIDGVKVGHSPDWLKKKLEAIGQRSINNIVDITNFIQFSLNKPMHAYDTRSIKGCLTARMAKGGEKLITLDEKELLLDENTLVIADEEKILGLAGIKGGKYSGIKDDTVSIVLESANFDPSLTRKTSRKFGLKTEASKRFENGIANSLIEDALYMTASLVREIFKDAKFGEVSDIYPKKDTSYYVGISLKELNDILGSSYKNEDIEKTLKQLSFTYEKIILEDYIKVTYPKLVGVKYKNPSSMRYDAPDSFSCSSLVSYLYKGIWMPSISIDKYVFSQKIKKEDLVFGDLVFANSGEGKLYTESIEFSKGTKVEGGIDHVGMYISDDEIIHATKLKGEVIIETLENFAKTRKIIGYGRITDNLKEERYVVNVPDERLDIRAKEDLAEEIGRIIGYEKLKPILPNLNKTGLIHKRMYYENKIREILVKNGFSEVMTYTFSDVGEVEIVKGLADDKEKLRNNLGSGLYQSLGLNLYNAPLLGEKVIKIFEMGNMFSNITESRYLALAIGDTTRKGNFTEEFESIIQKMKTKLGVNSIAIVKREVSEERGEDRNSSMKLLCIEIDFDRLMDENNLPEPTHYEVSTFATLPMISYKTISPYPFIVRDVAMWVKEGVSWEDIKSLCENIKNPLVVRIDLFDTFSKDGKVSFAFHLVFQSHEKTLTDDEVNKMMEEYYSLLKSNGYEIR